MTARYAIRKDLAWIEALDGGHPESVVWIADVDTGDMLMLEGTGWLAWVLIGDGASTEEELRAAAEAEGASGAFDSFDLPAFLDSLVERGALVRSAGR